MIDQVKYKVGTGISPADKKLPSFRSISSNYLYKIIKINVDGFKL